MCCWSHFNIRVRLINKVKQNEGVEIVEVTEECSSKTCGLCDRNRHREFRRGNFFLSGLTGTPMSQGPPERLIVLVDNTLDERALEATPDSKRSHTHQLHRVLCAAVAKRNGLRVVRVETSDDARALIASSERVASIAGVVLSGSCRSLRCPDHYDNIVRNTIVLMHLAFRPKNRRVPVLGICYGMQLLALMFGGRLATLPTARTGERCLRGLDGERLTVSVLHRDYVVAVPVGWVVTATADADQYATVIPMAMRHETQPFYAVQYHPEISNSEQIAEFVGWCDDVA